MGKNSQGMSSTNQIKAAERIAVAHDTIAAPVTMKTMRLSSDDQ
jgi:hypothetical protein